MNAVGKGILGRLDLLDHVGMSLVNKGIDDGSVQDIGILALGRRVLRILVHVVRRIEQFGAAINAELITLPVLLRTTIPAALVALMIEHVIDVLLCVLADYLGNFVAPHHGCTGGQDGEIPCWCGLFGLIG